MTEQTQASLEARLAAAEEALERFTGDIPRGYFALITITVHDGRKLVRSSLVSAQLLALGQPEKDELTTILGREIRRSIERGRHPQIRRRAGTEEKRCGNCDHFNQKNFCADPEDLGAGGKCQIGQPPFRWATFGDVCDGWKESVDPL